MNSNSIERLAQLIRQSLITKMRLESPIRNNFQVVPLSLKEFHVEMPIFPCKKAFCIGEDGKSIIFMNANDKLGGVIVPMFEISTCPSLLMKDIEKNSSIEDTVEIFLEKSRGIIEEETKLYTEIIQDAYGGRGWLLIRTDLTVLSASESGNITFSIFENIGIAVEPVK